MRRFGLLGNAGLILAILTTGAAPMRAQAVTGRLVVFNAGSLALPFRELLSAFARRHPKVTVAQESAGSLESARKLTELGKIPDVIGVADYSVIPSLLVPRYATWYVTFARNAMVLLHTEGSIGASVVDSTNWWQVLQRPGVRVGRSNPALDPAGYRAMMVWQLTERSLQQPGLASRLEAAAPPKYIRPKEADLTALVQTGELDYAWSYLSIARATGLRFVHLPDAVNLSDPRWSATYRHAVVRLPGARLGSTDSIAVTGEPIVYGLTIPTQAANRVTAEAFVHFVLSPEGRQILDRSGLIPLDRPIFGGPGTPPPSLSP